MPLTLTEAQLKPFWVHATEEVLAGVVAAWPAVQDTYQINTPLRCAHFWGQITVECGGGTELRENGHYSAKGILNTFGVGKHSAAVTQTEATELAAQCKIDGGRALFNRVYGIGNPTMAKQLGNTGPDDGWLFRGAGALNTTGREDIGRVGKAIGKDLVANPDLANNPGIGLEMGAEEYVNSLHCLQFADADNIRAETRRINGGYNGLDDRIAAIASFKKVFGV